MRILGDIGDTPMLELWGEWVRARRVQGERITLAVIELAPNAVVPEHRHPAEQLGVLVAGQMTWNTDGEVVTIGPGGTWRFLSDQPHGVTAGPEGAIAIEAFSPIRDDWDDRPVAQGVTPRWPPTAG